MPTGPQATSTVQQSPPSAVVPYAPTVDYEQAVVRAVEIADPSVVSIVISKNLPVIGQCPYEPFGDLPPEFRDFFGGGGTFYKPCSKGTKLQEVGGGSGFIVSSDGLILTNKHVAADSKAAYTVFTNDGKKYEAKILALDPVQDIALIKIDASDLTPVKLGDSDSIKLGQTAIAIGNALGEFRNTVSVGVISGLSRTITASGGGNQEKIEGVLQTDAAINPGNSGGPLLNLKGEVIGINTAIVSGAQNIGFAIPINRAKRSIESVKMTGSIKVPYFGVRYLLVTPELAKSQHLSVDYGALVRGSSDGSAVIAGSPAAKAGVQAEDVILEISGERIDQDHSLSSIIQKYNIGDVITLKVLRGKDTITLSITLEERPEL
ncbi:MAG: trypsin-like peptidase domain-containing protein [Parcubacteria group bacterium]|nr:trypsin-like peptidase domain-containing protein [Parcubacteria group bacterium]